MSLQQASSALWLATLSLMTAYMRTRAPAHRRLLARRIARNFDTLRLQQCFGPATRESFGRLARRWARRADDLAAQDAASAGFLAMLQRVFARSN